MKSIQINSRVNHLIASLPAVLNRPLKDTLLTSSALVSSSQLFLSHLSASGYFIPPISLHLTCKTCPSSMSVAKNQSLADRLLSIRASTWKSTLNMSKLTCLRKQSSCWNTAPGLSHDPLTVLCELPKTVGQSDGNKVCYKIRILRPGSILSCLSSIISSGPDGRFMWLG